MPTKKVSIIIVNWNTKDLLRNCLNSIKKQIEYPNYEIIVADNGSKDGSAEMVEKEFPDVRLIKNKENLGFSTAANQVIKAATGEYIFILGTDAIVTRGCLKNLVEIMESDDRVASVASTLSDSENVPQKGDKVVDNVCGTGMLIRKSAFDEIGMFDSKNFSPAYGEETDWNYRAQSVGYKVVRTTKSVVLHIHKPSAETGLGHAERYVLLNTHRIKAMLYNLSLINFLKRIPGLGLIFIRSFRERSTHLLFKAYWNNIKNFKNIIEERRKRKEFAKNRIKY